MLKLDVVARRCLSAEAISRKLGDCFALLGSQRHALHLGLGTPRSTPTEGRQTIQDKGMDVSIVAIDANRLYDECIHVNDFNPGGYYE
jgi:hypothetical protein